MMKEYTLKNSTFNIRYHDFPGDKSTIVFIHGLGCAGSFDYPDVASQPGMSEHRCILIDLLGSGYSDKPNTFNYTIQAHATYLLEFIQYLNLENFILFGHSLGGAIALTLASMAPERICTLILTEANLDSGGGFVTKEIATFTQNDFISTGFNKMIAENRRGSDKMWGTSFCTWLPKAAHQISKSAINGQIPSWRDSLYSGLPKNICFWRKKCK